MEHEATAVRADSPAPRSRDHARFTPGALVAERFRIIAPLGRGGMGEVYRADDVKLGQQVALKFLPQSLEHDRERLQRLYAEVRLGRQVSHPNVCRLYDIVEWQGSHFIAMEYIDGEDLGSLLRRIGKLPYEKAVELMHDICGGLAAAHGVGIIHRDLKPANIMIDGRGRARVTDFGLAAVDEDAAAGREIAGTPAYMAPEQLRGGPVSQKTDLYALGLIFYEMFTGRHHDTRSSGTGTRDRASRSTISEQTKDLDPAVQRVIVRCLEPDPDARPTSIHAVIAALPGADPLQAALDAGETPSPEMVAAAGVTGEIRPAIAVPLLIAAIALVLIAVAVKERTRLYSLVSMPMAPEALEQRAKDITATLGAPPARDTATVYISDRGYWTDKPVDNAIEDVRKLRPAPLIFVFHASPQDMVPINDERLSGTMDDPPFTVPGMSRVMLDPSGHLLDFAVVPRHGVAARAPFDWKPLLATAGFDPTQLKAATPEWIAPVDTDAKFAWTGAYASHPNVPMRIEAASFRGHPVYFTIVPPWRTPPTPDAPRPPALVRWMERLIVGTVGVLLVAALILARRNLRRGRADRGGALRTGVAIVVVVAAGRVLRSYHTTDAPTELTIMFDAGSFAVWMGALSWLMYLAVEPYLRRRWPKTLVAWSRLLGGKPGDPLVGRDLLIATIAGAACALVHGVMLLYLRQPELNFASSLAHTRHAIYTVLYSLMDAATNALLIGVLLLVSHLIVRNRIAAVALTALVFMSTVGSPGVNTPVELLARLLISATFVLVFVRLGVLAAAATMFVTYTIAFAPMTLTASSYLFGRSLIALAVIALIAGYGFYRALGTQPVFAGAVLDD